MIPARQPTRSNNRARQDWQRRAAAIGAWRELSGYDHPADPIGPEPVAAAPDLRAAWHEALVALGPADGPDVRGMSDGLLLHLRDTYPLETAWAPQYVGDELRQVRAAARDAHLNAIHAAAEAHAARHRGQHQDAGRQQALAASYQAMHDAYLNRETILAAVMADRADWDTATRHQRHLAAAAADAELSPPPLRPQPPAPALRRTLAPHPAPARRTHPHPRTAHPRDWPVDQGSGRPASRLRRQTGRPAEPAPPVRGSRLRRSRPGLPTLASSSSGRHPATAQTRDRAIRADPATRPGSRPAHGSGGLRTLRSVLLCHPRPLAAEDRAMKAPAEPGNERLTALTALPGSPPNSVKRRIAWIGALPPGSTTTNIAYVTYVSNVRYIRADQDMINVSYRAPMPDDVINPYADEPLYVQLAGIVRRKIESGELKHLDPVPSESSLGQGYGVSRDTVRRAVALLRDEGVVFTVPHRGTYVGPRPK